MLDTVVLTLDWRQFEVLQPERFSPSAKGLLVPPYYPLGARGNFTCVQNPTKADFQGGRYLPRLTLAKRKIRNGFALTLRIEFSAPKLVFGNNFDELESRDFRKVLVALHRGLAHMGIGVSTDVLRQARVSAIHYSKNIAFVDYTTCSMVMSELDLIDLNSRLDLSHTDYRNNGHVIRYHANSFEVTFYDKLKDLDRARYSQKRAIEQDYGAQLEMFGKRGSFPKQLEVLRIEARLGTRAKITSLLKRIGATPEPAFEALFNTDIAKSVLEHFWANVRARLPLSYKSDRLRPEDLLSALAYSAKGTVKIGKLLQQLGCAVLVGSVGIRGASAALSRHCSPRSWQRYKRELRGLPVHEAGAFRALKQVDQALSRFEPLRMKSFHATAGDSPAGRSRSKEPNALWNI
jgi:hypothetical protein